MTDLTKIDKPFGELPSNRGRVTDPVTGKRAERCATGPTCPRCGSSEVKVYDSRHSIFNGTGSVFRTRRCQDCQEKWNTYEISEAGIDEIKRGYVKDLLQKLIGEIQ